MYIYCKDNARTYKKTALMILWNSHSNFRYQGPRAVTTESVFSSRVPVVYRQTFRSNTTITIIYDNVKLNSV